MCIHCSVDAIGGAIGLAGDAHESCVGVGPELVTLDIFRETEMPR